MDFLRYLILFMAVGTLLACASAPAPTKKPKHIRLSTRQLNKGARLYTKGCYANALKHFQEAHERYTAADDHQGMAHSLNGMANVYYRMEAYQSALRVYDDAIEVYRIMGDRGGLVRALAGKSAALMDAGQLDQADAVLAEADDQASAGNLLTGLRFKIRALLMLQRNDVETAETLMQKALGATREDDLSQWASAQYTMGYILLYTRRSAQAISHFEKALRVDREAGAYAGIAEDLEALGTCHVLLGQHSQAVSCFKRSLKIFALLRNTKKVKVVVDHLEKSAIRAGEDIQTTLHWTNQWLAGKQEANLCR